MRWLLTSWGSHGDLHPYLALGRGLLARGHEVTFAGHPEWQEAAEIAGLRFISTNEVPREDLVAQHPEIFSTKFNGLISLHTLIRGFVVPGLEPMYQTLIRAARDHDAMLAHHFVFSAPVAAEVAGIPWATVTLAPNILPTAYSLPGADFGKIRHGILSRAKNRLLWWCGRHCVSWMVDPHVNRMRKKHDLAPIHDAVFGVHSPYLNLLLYSEHFAPRPPDWSPEKRIAGFCYYDPPGAALAPEIETFLQQGEPAVLFTLGSTAVQKPGAFFQSAVQALETLGLRGILLIGPETNRPARLPDSILAVSYASYGLLMPRVRAVAHQCGIGTLSHTLRAGVPSVACPFAFDQPNNARRLEALGVAEVVLPHQHDARHIGEALNRLLAGDAPARAQRLGELIRAEDGVTRACNILEEVFTPSG